MNRYDELHPEFRPIAQKILTHVAHLSSLSGIKWTISSAFRSPDRQMELFLKGRRLVNGSYVKTGGAIVTNARPDQTPHCITLPDGTPASCAIDIALLLDGKFLADKDPRWGIIGAAVGLADATGIVTWGGMFSSIRDFPHIELTTWKTKVNVGKGAK